MDVLHTPLSVIEPDAWYMFGSFVINLGVIIDSTVIDPGVCNTPLPVSICIPFCWIVIFFQAHRAAIVYLWIVFH